MPYASERSKRRRCEGAGGTTPLERQVGMQIGSCLFAYDFGYKIIFLYIRKFQIEGGEGQKSTPI